VCKIAEDFPSGTGGAALEKYINAFIVQLVDEPAGVRVSILSLLMRPVDVTVWFAAKNFESRLQRG
jgi:hypothetical protein